MSSVAVSVVRIDKGEAVTPPGRDAVSILLNEAEAISTSEPGKAAELIQRGLGLAYQAAIACQASPPASGAVRQEAAHGSSQNFIRAQVPSSECQQEGLLLPTPEDALRLYEQGVMLLTTIYLHEANADAIRALLASSLHVFKLLPKARVAKLVRILVDSVASIPGAEPALIEFCKECIRWSLNEKRAFLRIRLELRLAQVYVLGNRFSDSQHLLKKLLCEVKKLDDKPLLVEMHLLDSELNFKIRNIPKSRAALTAARTNANAIHCPPTLQGQLDLQAGILHAHDRDFKTAFSYFFEAFETFSNQEMAQVAQRKHARTTGIIPHGTKDERGRALQALKYLILSKILMGKPEDVPGILTAKQSLRYYNQTELALTKPDYEAREEPNKMDDMVALRELDGLRLLAVCHKQRSLKSFEEVLQSHEELQRDPILQHHISELYETLLEQNLSKILQAFSRVELSHVAKLIDLPEKKVEAKLSEMMLDGKLLGTLDQGVGVLVLFEKQETPQLYTDVLGTVANVANVVDALYEKAQQTL